MTYQIDQRYLYVRGEELKELFEEMEKQSQEYPPLGLTSEETASWRRARAAELQRLRRGKRKAEENRQALFDACGISRHLIDLRPMTLTRAPCAPSSREEDLLF